MVEARLGAAHRRYAGVGRHRCGDVQDRSSATGPRQVRAQDGFHARTAERAAGSRWREKAQSNYRVDQTELSGQNRIQRSLAQLRGETITDDFVFSGRPM